MYFNNNNAYAAAPSGIVTAGYLPNYSVMTGTHGHEPFYYTTDY